MKHQQTPVDSGFLRQICHGTIRFVTNGVPDKGRFQSHFGIVRVDLLRRRYQPDLFNGPVNLFPASRNLPPRRCPRLDEIKTVRAKDVRRLFSVRALRYVLCVRHNTSRHESANYPNAVFRKADFSNDPRDSVNMAQRSW